MSEQNAALIDNAMEQLAQIKLQQKELSTQESDLKALLLILLEQEHLDNVVSDYGKVHVQVRKEKKYDGAIVDAEEDLKERKKLADDLGDYTIIKEKKSLVFTL
jgi:hypothetical protein